MKRKERNKSGVAEGKGKTTYTHSEWVDDENRKNSDVDNELFILLVVRESVVIVIFFSKSQTNIFKETPKGCRSPARRDPCFFPYVTPSSGGICDVQVG